MKRTLQSMLLALSLSANAQTVSTATIENAVKDVGGRAASTVIDIQKPETIVPKYNNTQTGNGDLFGEGYWTKNRDAWSPTIVRMNRSFGKWIVEGFAMSGFSVKQDKVFFVSNID